MNRADQDPQAAAIDDVISAAAFILSLAALAAIAFVIGLLAAPAIFGA